MTVLLTRGTKVRIRETGAVDIVDADATGGIFTPPIFLGSGRLASRDDLEVLSVPATRLAGPPPLPAEIARRRRAVADSLFEGHTIKGEFSGATEWEEEGPDRLIRAVDVYAPQDEEEEEDEGVLFRFQYNVEFQPMSAEVVEAYEGQWFRPHF